MKQSIIRRTLIVKSSLVVALLVSGCTSFVGGARVYDFANNPVDEVPGLVGSRTGDSYVLYVHGMGNTPEDFHAELLSKAESILGATVSPSLASVPDCAVSDYCRYVRLPEEVHLRGEGLDCTVQDDCKLKDFGELRVYEVSGGNRRVFFYTYFWNAVAGKLQKQYKVTDTKIADGPVWLNALVKDHVVNYGFSDAALYLGPFGAAMRQGLESAICLMLSDAIGRAKDTSMPNGTEPCELSTLANPDDLETISSLSVGFAAKSLGSRYLFDALSPLDQVTAIQGAVVEQGDGFSTDPSSDGIEKAIRAINVKRSLLQSASNVFMLANQLPLLGLGQIQVNSLQQQRRRDFAYCQFVLNRPDTECRTSVFQVQGGVIAQQVQQQDLAGFVTLARAGERLTIVAFHDPNDLLGYKAGLHLTESAEEAFDVVEVSNRNAPVWLFSFAWPPDTHAREDKRQTASRIIWCGGDVTQSGKIEPLDCAARAP